MDLGLKGKNVLVTGGATGIGFATARLFLEEGATVVLTGRREEKLKEAAKELKSADLYYYSADISSLENL